MEAASSLLVLVAVAGTTMAVPASALAELVHEPALVRPPRLPAALAGLFRLRGRVVPVLRPEVLLDLPPPSPGPFRVLLVFHGAGGGRWALLVERALGVVEAPAHSLAPVPGGHSLGACVTALLAGPDGGVPDGGVPVLAPERLLLRREELAVAEFTQWAEQRWEDFSGGHP